jgi:glyoxylase-like metal-dependent hydrolase (beta-lactamase superfamily II)
MLSVGDSQVVRIEELNLELWTTLLPDWRKEMADQHREWLAPRFYTPDRDMFKVSIHSWLVKTPRHQILIDTCSGNHKLRPTFKLLNQLDTPWLDRLQGAGVSPEDVDYVICTHFHVDHVGWNTRRVGNRWVPTFPNATYVLSRVEREVRDPQFGVAKQGSPDHMIFLDSILPVIEAGQARMVEGDEALAEGVDLVPAPGHAPGQMAVRVRSRGEEAMFVGDVMHHPLQIHHPQWNTNLCEDPDMARRTRVRILEHCVEHASLLAPAHFASPHCGQVIRAGSGFAFQPSERVP